MWNESNDEDSYEEPCLAEIEHFDDGDDDEEDFPLYVSSLDHSPLTKFRFINCISHEGP